MHQAMLQAEACTATATLMCLEHFCTRLLSGQTHITGILLCTTQKVVHACDMCTRHHHASGICLHQQAVIRQ